MSSYSVEQIKACLQTVTIPGSQTNCLDGTQIKEIQLDEGEACLHLALPVACASQHGMLIAQLQQAFTEAGIASLEVTLSTEVPAHERNSQIAAVNGIKNIVAVASGKGGVGKSTTSVNLALALVAEGAKVGLLDADIYGPSQQLMLGMGSETRPEQKDGKYFLPVEAHGLQTMSMGYLVTDKTPMVWRGPMVSGALQQMLNQTLWQDLDYLIIDLPPGTGDIQLTLSQQVPVNGAVIVTTPQDIALADAVKATEMFAKVNVSVLGVIENMAYFHCENCGHESFIFGSKGGEKLAKEYDVSLLGALPLQLAIREQTDAGNPTVVADPTGKVAETYREIARQVSLSLWQNAATEGLAYPAIEISED